MEHTIASALADIRGVKIDKTAMRAHAMRPSHVLDVVSSKGLEEGTPHPEFAFPITGTFPYYFDVDGASGVDRECLTDTSHRTVWRRGSESNRRRRLWRPLYLIMNQ
jgi:hypothetical protein